MYVKVGTGGVEDGGNEVKYVNNDGWEGLCCSESGLEIAKILSSMIVSSFR